MSSKKLRPIALSVEQNLKEFIDLPYPPDVLDSLALFIKGSIYFPFHKIISESVESDFTNEEIFGVGEIQINNGFRVKNYLLPTKYPSEKSFAKEERSFQLQALTGNDLIFSLKGPLLPEPFLCHNYIFCFDTESKQWSRILKIAEDGSYQKVPMAMIGRAQDFPEDSEKNAFRSTFGKLIIWSPKLDKIRIEVDDTAEDQFGDRILEEGIEVKEFYKEKQEAEALNQYQNFSAWGVDPLTLDQYVQTGRDDSWNTIIHYTITGLERLFNRRAPTFHDQYDQKEVHIYTQRAVKLKRGKKGVVGIFARYSLPGEWHRGVFLVFEYDME